MHRGGYRLLHAAVVAGLSGCAVGPDYLKPPMETPGAFTGTVPGLDRNALAVLQSETSDIGRWWLLLKDRELQSLIERAVATNPDIEIAAMRIRQARENEVAVRGVALPGVEVTAGAGGGTGTNSTRGRVSPPLNAATNTTGLKEITYVAGFDAGWEIDVFGKNRRAYEAAGYLTDVAVEGRHAALVSIVSEVARAYVETRGLQAKLNVSHKNIERAQKSLDLVRTRFQRGLTNELDVTLAGRQFDTLKARQAPLYAEEFAACARIATLLDRPSREICEELTSFKKIPDTPERIKTGLPADLLRRRPDVRAAERALAVETARIGVAVADLFPRVAITTGGGAQGQGLGVLPVVSQSIYSVGPALYWPLLDFGTLDANVKMQELRANAQFLSYKRTVLASVEEVNVALSRYRAVMVTLKSLQDAVQESKRAVDLASERYERGLSDYLNVLDAERQEFDLNIQYAEAKTDAAKAFIALYKALGGGWEMFEEELPAPIAHPAVVAAFEHLPKGG